MTRHVLVIDDEEDLRAIARVALETLGGLRCTLAGSGAEGAQAAAVDPPDAVLIDLMLGDEDGLAVASRLRTVPGMERCTLLLMTAAPHPPSSAAIDGVIAKPFDPHTLAHAVAVEAGWDS